MALRQNQRRQDRHDKNRDNRDQAAASPAPPPPPPPPPAPTIPPTTAAPAPTTTSDSRSISSSITSTTTSTKSPRPTKSVTETLTVTPTPTASTTPQLPAQQHQMSHGDKTPSYALLVAVPLICVLFLCVAILALVFFLRKRNGERRRRSRASTSTTASEEDDRRGRSRRYKKEPKRTSSKSTLGSTTLGSSFSYSPKQPALQEERAFGAEPEHITSPVRGMTQPRPMSGASSVYPEDYHHHIQQIHQNRVSEFGNTQIGQMTQPQAPAPAPPERSVARSSPRTQQGAHELQVPFGGMLPLNRPFNSPLSPPPQEPPPPPPTRPMRPDRDDTEGKWLPAPLRVGKRWEGTAAGNTSAF